MQETTRVEIMSRRSKGHAARRGSLSEVAHRASPGKRAICPRQEPCKAKGYLLGEAPCSEPTFWKGVLESTSPKSKVFFFLLCMNNLLLKKNSVHLLITV